MESVLHENTLRRGVSWEEWQDSPVC